ncbi:MAG: MalY/PatB family protein [Erysipelotrichaceae bacterium]
MNKINFDQVIDRHATHCIKWDHLNQNFDFEGEDGLALWVADMDFPCSEAIIEAISQRLTHPIFGYGDEDDPEYDDALIQWFKRRFDWQIKADNIFFSPGVVPALAFLIQAITQIGDGIIIQSPVYYPFAKKIINNNRIVVDNPLINTNGVYTMDFIDLENKMKQPKVKGMILCSPHNPVGRVWHESELKEVVRIASKYHKWIISDEIHGDLIRKGNHHVPLAKCCPEYQDQIITCSAPSKSFNLAGLQNSNIIIFNKEFQEAWKKIVMDQASLSSCNTFARVATIAAYNKSEDWLNQCNAYLDENYLYLKQYLEKECPKAIVSPCEGTYLAWIDFSNYVKNQEELETLMVKKAHLVFDEGILFGEAGSCFERINFACPRAILKQALERICVVLSN